MRGLAIAADPHAYAQNDEMCRVFLQSFCGRPPAPDRTCALRRPQSGGEIGTLPPRSGFVMRAAGMCPPRTTFCSMGCRLFHNHHGIVLGVSAGSMNAAPSCTPRPRNRAKPPTRHYSQAADERPWPDRRPASCPITSSIRDHVLDGQKVEDIALADSKKRHFSRFAGRLVYSVRRRQRGFIRQSWYFADGWKRSTKTEDVLRPTVSATKAELRQPC